MKTTPYELVFGQPPRGSAFPGVVTTGTSIMEEDIEELLEDEGEGVKEAPTNGGEEEKGMPTAGEGDKNSLSQ